ncbi:hypothetical protein BJ546DRAFT_965628 [Cryomyces antarcticus]
MSALQSYLSPIAHTLATLFSIVIMFFGVRSMIATRDYLTTFGLPLKDKSNTPVTVKSNPWVQLAGARNITFGASIVASQYLGDFRAMGTIFLCGLATSATDAYVTWNYGERKAAWSHINGTIFAALLGTYFISIS